MTSRSWSGDPRGQGPHRPAVRRQPARRRRRRPRPRRPADPARREGRVVRAGAQAGADQKLKEHGIVVMPSIGAAKPRGEGRQLGRRRGDDPGRRGRRPHRPGADHPAAPEVLDAVDIPVVAAGGFFDGRGLAAALSYGAAGIGMGTRFLLTADSTVPEAVKQPLSRGRPQRHGRDHQGRRYAAPDARTELVEEVEETSPRRRLAPTVRNGRGVQADERHDRGASWSRRSGDEHGRSCRGAGGHGREHADDAEGRTWSTAGPTPA